MSAFRLFLPASAAVLLASIALGGAGSTKATPPPVTSGDAARGKAVFARCAICHAVKPGINTLGPSLAAVVGRKAAVVPGYPYSPALRAAGIVWTPAQLDAFLSKPAAKVPGNKMAFAGLAIPTDRADVIAYLQSAK